MSNEHFFKKASLSRKKSPLKKQRKGSVQKTFDLSSHIKQNNSQNSMKTQMSDSKEGPNIWTTQSCLLAGAIFC